MDSAWPTLTVLAAGIVVVIGGVLVLRLHAFLALILGALVVGALTPNTAIENSAISNAAINVRAVNPQLEEVLLNYGPGSGALPGAPLLVLRLNDETGRYETLGHLRIERFDQVQVRSEKTIPIAIASFTDDLDGVELREDDVVIHPVDLKSAEKLRTRNVGQRVADEFGDTCGQIGILIAMASIIGKCLLDSGAADRIVRSALRLLGEAGAPLAFIGSGFLLGIPVFFDTVFYLMIPLGKAMRMRTGRNYLLYVLTIVAGGTMAHSLVPPTPGPLFVAEQLGVDMGMMILAGCIVGLFTSGFGLIFAALANRVWDLPLRETPDFSLADLEHLSRREDHELPGFWVSLLPIILPVILIAGNTVLAQLPPSISLPPDVLRIAETLGDKNIALVISAAIAMATLVHQKRANLGELAPAMQGALASGGLIILITAAGGAFGGMLQQTGVAGLIRDMPLGTPAAIVTLAFLITTAIRTAQGSATVAMITAVGILAGISSAEQLGFHPVYLALAIGCGSKPIAWMNDSGFWVIGKMSGMTEGETLKYVTPMTTLMGVVGLVVVIAGVTFLPLV